MQFRAFLGAMILLTSSAGCIPQSPPPTNTTNPPDVEIELTGAQERQSRRAYHGAPPVIPHTRLGASCTDCHTKEGKLVAGHGAAPANPHHETSAARATFHCNQCHVFSQTNDEFAVSNYLPWRLPLHGERLYPTAPPVIPHSLFMRENCAACHSGVAARPEVRCSHPERANCRQCHVPQ